MKNDSLQPLISVIVPVYNTSEYLKRCIDSLTGQTFRDYEIVLVNDGSTDISPTICRDYADRFSCIRFVSQENGGLSAARNTGVAESVGKYVTFVDSDDFVADNYLEALVNQIEDGRADMSAVGFRMFSNMEETEDFLNSGDSKVLKGREALLEVLYQKSLDTHAWGILIPREFAERYPFPVGRFHEDDMTTYKYYSTAEKVSVSQDELYFYYQRPGSIMRLSGKAKNDELEAADNLVSAFAHDAELKKAAESKCFSNYCQVFLACPDMRNEDKETWFRVRSYIIKKRWQILFDKNTRAKNKLAALALMAGTDGLRAVSRLKG